MNGKTDMCFVCGEYVPEGRQVCTACEKENALRDMDHTPDGVIRRWRPAIIRAARSQPAKLANRQAVYELGLIGLSAQLARISENPDDVQCYKTPLIRAIAETRVLIERLAVMYCTSKDDADAYRFYLSMAARAADPQQKAVR